MGAGLTRRWRGGLNDFQPCRAVRLRLELGGLRRGEEVGVEEVAAEERFEFPQGLAEWVVLRDIAGGVTPEEREMRAGLQGDRPHEKILQGSVGAAIFSEGEFDQGTVTQRGAEQIEETVASGGRRHRGEVATDFPDEHG